MTDSTKSTEELRDLVKDAVGELLDDRRRISESQHSVHHQYVEQKIRKEKARQDRREKVAVQVVGWGIISTIGGTVIGLFYVLKDYAVQLIRHITTGG